jgi:hypothetical protein
MGEEQKLDACFRDKTHPVPLVGQLADLCEVRFCRSHKRLLYVDRLRQVESRHDAVIIFGIRRQKLQFSYVSFFVTSSHFNLATNKLDCYLSIMPFQSLNSNTCILRHWSLTSGRPLRAQAEHLSVSSSDRMTARPDQPLGCGCVSKLFLSLK